MASSAGAAARARWRLCGSVTRQLPRSPLRMTSARIVLFSRIRASRSQSVSAAGLDADCVEGKERGLAGWWTRVEAFPRRR
jgi:hypothetical protein